MAKAKAKVKTKSKPTARKKPKATKPVRKAKPKRVKAGAKRKVLTELRDALKPSTEPMSTTGKPTTAVELEVAQMLADDAAGHIDNVFDIVDELMDLDQRLPANSALRPKWDKFFSACEKLLMEYA